MRPKKVFYTLINFVGKQIWIKIANFTSPSECLTPRLVKILLYTYNNLKIINIYNVKFAVCSKTTAIFTMCNILQATTKKLKNAAFTLCSLLKIKHKMEQ